MQSATPDPTVTPDLAATVAALIGRRLHDDEAIAVAVSGGPDSLALMLLAHRAFGSRLRVLTVDHGLRPESAGEAAMVATYAASLGILHTTLRWDEPRPGSNLQAAARASRYRLMTDHCLAHGIGWLATAHHQGDHAETLLLRLARGSGSSGLAGIRARRPLSPGVALLRPLLGATKTDLADVVAAAGWVAVDDPSNQSPRYDRTQARAVLAAASWLAPERLAASAAHLAEVEAALVWTADIAWRGRVTVSAADITIDAAGLPRELARRLLVRAVAVLAPAATPRGPAVDRLLGRLNAGLGGTIAGVAVTARATASDAIWAAKVAAPRR
ncbi:tRNA lysidine(34) synthetase TilS [Polymorphobacter sp. PAMC 29334]|uniref:tRNA lysidine(34) synthetase TilS n=1 Tax=Polymorphobacter sp. PAMC 29334 TaxID=2862331 RepID=UPI001C772C87|nr:tRNA lysidine(34) synthetase TilS [Polymorphobacter sp. PAMC 29334]QYE36061.1 tRNA lysidine(34) synthetase TilS [Polymorphobacter sp. PAMC 29334]